MQIRDPLARLDPVAMTAMFAANRIASQLERIAALSTDGRFGFEAGVLDEVLGLVAKALHDWIVTLGDAARPADLRAGTEALRLEATGLFADMRRQRSLSAIAIRARQWASAVKGWAQLTGGMPL